MPLYGAVSSWSLLGSYSPGGNSLALLLKLGLMGLRLRVVPRAQEFDSPSRENPPVG